MKAPELNLDLTLRISDISETLRVPSIRLTASISASRCFSSLLVKPMVVYDNLISKSSETHK